MKNFIPILIGAMLCAKNLAEEDYNKPYPPTPPKHHLRALKDDDNRSRPECDTNTTDEADKIYPRNGLINPSYRWKEFDVYPDPSFSEEEREKITDAVWELSKVIPCTEFGVWKRTSNPRGDYVHIRKRNDRGCSAQVGRRGGAQNMNLKAPECMDHDTILHELLHALGFEHEHERSDRDDFVTIHWDNIKDGQKHNFEKQSANRVTHYGVPYNIKSIMHYESTAFSKNKQPTITDKAGRTFKPSRALEETDKQKLKKMYNCA